MLNDEELIRFIEGGESDRAEFTIAANPEEEFGMGIPLARRALAENGNPPPEFDVQDTFVFATIRKSR